ncbi:MAG: hypothetical protein HZC28_15570 [Spirochaetes bacterium]|nr:hypothetical protein [Spirochaetota bacterium]
MKRVLILCCSFLLAVSCATVMDEIKITKKIEMEPANKKLYTERVLAVYNSKEFAKVIKYCHEDKDKLDAAMVPVWLSEAYYNVGNFDEAIRNGEAIGDAKKKALRLALAYSAKKWYNKAFDYYRDYFDKGGKIDDVSFSQRTLNGFTFATPDYWISIPSKKLTEGEWDIYYWNVESLYGLTYRFSAYEYTTPVIEDTLPRVVETMKKRISLGYEKAANIPGAERSALKVAKKGDVGSFKGLFSKSLGSDMTPADATVVWYMSDNQREKFRTVYISILPGNLKYIEKKMRQSMLLITVSFYYYNSDASDRFYKTELEPYLEKMVQR